ncbi:MAG: FAD binding domain-containing protein [Elusimicrobiota bacterium]
MLPEFDYYRAKNIEDALEKLSAGNYEIIAGGTDMVVELRKEKSVDFDILDITGLEELKGIYQKENGEIFIGALTVFGAVRGSRLLKEKTPLLCEGVKNAGSVQIRNRGTIGGNICNASPAADSVPALVAMDARAVILNRSGQRTLPVEELITWPYTNALEDGEILKGVILKPMDSRWGYSFYKLGRREALAISRMNVAVMVDVKDNVIKEAVISPGSVMPSPQKVKPAQDILAGEEPSEELFDRAGKEVARVMIEESGRRWSTDYKEPVIQAMVKRALTEAAGSEF